MGAYDIHRRPTKFLRMLYQQIHSWLGLKETELDKMKEGCQIPTTVQARNRLIKLFGYKYTLALKKTKKESSPGSPRGQGLRHRRQNHRCRDGNPNHRPGGQTHKLRRTLQRRWNPQKFALLGFEIGWDCWYFSSFHFPFFVMERSVTAMLCLSHHCILGRDTLFSSFTDSEI